MTSTFCPSPATDAHGECIELPDHEYDHRDGYGNTWPDLPDFIALYNAYQTARRAFRALSPAEINDRELTARLDREYVAAYHALKAAAAQLDLMEA